MLQMEVLAVWVGPFGTQGAPNVRSDEDDKMQMELLTR